MTVTRVLDVLTAGSMRRRIEAIFLEYKANTTDELDLHAGAILRGRAAQLRAWAPT